MLETGPAAERTWLSSIPAAGEYVHHMHLLSSGGRTVNTEQTGASFGAACGGSRHGVSSTSSAVLSAARFCWATICVGCRVCCTLSMKKTKARCPGNWNRIRAVKNDLSKMAT